MLNVVMLNVVMLNVVMLNVVMLRVVAPCWDRGLYYKTFHGHTLYSITISWNHSEKI